MNSKDLTRHTAQESASWNYSICSLMSDQHVSGSRTSYGPQSASARDAEVSHKPSSFREAYALLVQGLPVLLLGQGRHGNGIQQACHFASGSLAST